MLDLKPLADSLESYARSLETYARQIKSIGEILRSIEDQIEEQTHGAHNDSTRSTHASRTSTREPRLSPAADTKDHGEIRRYNAEGQTRGQTRLSHEFRQEAQTRQEAKFSGVFRRTREAHLEHENAKTELKALIPEDAREAIGHGIRAKRSKSGAVSFDVLSMEGSHAPL